MDDEVVCYAGAALQRWREDVGDKVEPGLIPIVLRVTAEEQRSRLLSDPG